MNFLDDFSSDPLRARQCISGGLQASRPAISNHFQGDWMVCDSFRSGETGEAPGDPGGSTSTRTWRMVQGIAGDVNGQAINCASLDPLDALF